MSKPAKDLLELGALPAPENVRHGALTELLMRAIAAVLIADGVTAARGIA